MNFKVGDYVYYRFVPDEIFEIVTTGSFLNGIRYYVIFRVDPKTGKSDPDQISFDATERTLSPISPILLLALLSI